MTYLQLCFEFFKTGLLAIGGGLATIPFLREIAGRYDWYTNEELGVMIAVSESTPGPLGVNMATFAGFSAAGLAGGLMATLALVLPPMIAVLIISRFMKRFRESRIVAGTFSVLRPAAAGLIAGAVFVLLSMSLINAGNTLNLYSGALYLVLTLLCFAGEVKKLNIHPFVFIAAGAAAGVLLGGRLT